jgi:hypothetical protein
MKKYATDADRMAAHLASNARYRRRCGIVERTKFASDDERLEAKRLSNRRYEDKRKAARQARQPIERAVKPPKPPKAVKVPKPPKQQVALRKEANQRVVIANERRETKQVRVEIAAKPELPDTEAFMRANPQRVEFLPIGKISEPRPVFNARERRMLLGDSLDPMWRVG